MITSAHRQESLTRAYIQAVAGHVGMTCSTRDFDYGIDITLHEVTVRTSRRTHKKRYIETGMPLDIQAKSTTGAIVNHEGVQYDLDIAAYDDLRDTDVMTPRILVLLVLPVSEEEQLNQTEESLSLRRCCYWVCLKGSEPVRNRTSKRVSLPRKNVFSEEGLREIMKRVKKGESL